MAHGGEGELPENIRVFNQKMIKKAKI